MSYGRLIAAVVAVVVGFVTWRVLRWFASPQMQFVLLQRMIDRFKKAPPATVVRALLNNRQSNAAHTALCEMGPAVVPFLIAAIDQPEFHRVPKPKPIRSIADLLTRTPLESVLRCLGNYAPPEAVPAVAPLVTDNRAGVRAAAARLLGTIGTDATIAPLQQALADADDDVRGSVFTGVLRAAKAGRATIAFRNQAFEMLTALAFQESGVVFTTAPCCLLALDRDRAIAWLTTPDRLVPDAEGLCGVLHALREAEAHVNPVQLQALYQALASRPESHTRDGALGQTLRLLAIADPGVARPVVEKMLASPLNSLRESALEALAELEGVRDPFADALAREERDGWASLPAPVQHYVAVFLLDAEANNGGFDQYFYNPYAEHWRTALVGLEAIGATHNLDIARRAFAIFGPDGPSRDRAVRQRELNRLGRRDRATLLALNREWYEDMDGLRLLLLKYVAAHVADFRPDQSNVAGTSDTEA